MTSHDDSNIPPVNDSAKATWPVIGARVHPDDRKLIDLAAVEAGEKRGPFIVAAAVERAKAILLARRAADRRSA